MKDSRKKLLQLVYDHDQSVGGVLQIPMDGSGTDLDLVTLRDDVTTLIRQGYLTQPIRIIRTFCPSLTEKGEEYVENGFSLPSPSQSSYNFSGATIHNATIGNENTVDSMVYNSTSALSELESAINHQP